ncbi:acetyltransferase [Enterococcus sp. JM4C]|nr:acetyltransferase [Enterococcus sp. JM4C]
MNIKQIGQIPARVTEAANWFHEKWEIPAEAYLESMQTALNNPTGIPKWYVVLDENEQIIAGAGVIENDFHDRLDLTPNLCALYVNEGNRGQKIAEKLLAYICSDMKQLGLHKLYLVTDHKGLYEKYGWSYLTMVQAEDGPIQMYAISLDE